MNRLSTEGRYPGMSSPPQPVPSKFNTEYIYIYPQTPLEAAKISLKSTSCVCGYIINNHNENQDASVCDCVVCVLSSGNQF